MNKRKENHKGFLPENAAQAIQRLTKISQALLDLSERETQALVQNDMFTFSILQDEKELLASQYTKASEEFRSRLEEFRKIDRNLLGRLENIQKKLAEKTQGNNIIVTQMRQRAEKNTHKTLITAQELGQKKPLSYTKSASIHAQQERV